MASGGSGDPDVVGRERRARPSQVGDDLRIVPTGLRVDVEHLDHRVRQELFQLRFIALAIVAKEKSGTKLSHRYRRHSNPIRSIYKRDQFPVSPPEIAV